MQEKIWRHSPTLRTDMLQRVPTAAASTWPWPGWPHAGFGACKAGPKLRLEVSGGPR